MGVGLPVFSRKKLMIKKVEEIMAAMHWGVVHLSLGAILRERYCRSYFTGEEAEVQGGEVTGTARI